jgi:hypothetical protein
LWGKRSKEWSFVILYNFLFLNFKIQKIKNFFILFFAMSFIAIFAQEETPKDGWKKN